MTALQLNWNLNGKHRNKQKSTQGSLQHLEQTENTLFKQSNRFIFTRCRASYFKF